jgi:molybdenum cofactor cytidylyltransferase
MIGNRTDIEILILAAGSSSRLGQPKQLLKFQGTTLIRRIVQEALNSGVGKVTVVTGYDNKKISAEIADMDISQFYNMDWKEGLGTSIRNGLTYLLAINPHLSAVILTMVDQPLVDAAHLKKLADTYDPSRPMIVASAYSGTFGVPVLVDSHYFDQLKTLQGDEGGKKIFAAHLENIIEIPFSGGAIDIDEEKDLQSLL